MRFVITAESGEAKTAHYTIVRSREYVVNKW